jgi:hypothetical protein
MAEDKGVAAKSKVDVDFSNDLSVAYWCGSFSCRPADLRWAAEVLGSNCANDIGMFLADHGSQSPARFPPEPV